METGDGDRARRLQRRKQEIHAAGLLVIGQVLHRFLGVVHVCGACAFIVCTIIMMVQDVTSVLCHVLGDELRAISAAAAHMGEVAFHGGKGLPWKHQHQQNQKHFLHLERSRGFCGVSYVAWGLQLPVGKSHVNTYFRKRLWRTAAASTFYRTRASLSYTIRRAIRQTSAIGGVAGIRVKFRKNLCNRLIFKIILGGRSKEPLIYC